GRGRTRPRATTAPDGHGSGAAPRTVRPRRGVGEPLAQTLPGIHYDAPRSSLPTSAAIRGHGAPPLCRGRAPVLFSGVRMTGGDTTAVTRSQVHLFAGRSLPQWPSRFAS